MTTKKYLGINDHIIGPPPNWRDDRFWVRKFFRHKFNSQKYIFEVERYIKDQHTRHWDTICKYDECVGERGDTSEYLEGVLDNAMNNVKVAKDQMTEWADRWRLTAKEYEHKYENMREK